MVGGRRFRSFQPFPFKRPFRRQLRWLMRPTFVAAKVGKTAHAAKAPGKLRRVPCDARFRRDAPNSLPSVAQTCGASFSAWPCASRRHRGRWVAADRSVQLVTGFRRCGDGIPRSRRQTGDFGRCRNFNIRQEIKSSQQNHSNWQGVRLGNSTKTGPDTKPPVRSGLLPRHLLPVEALLPTFQAIVKSRSPASAQREAKPPLRRPTQPGLTACYRPPHAQIPLL